MLVFYVYITRENKERERVMRHALYYSSGFFLS